LLSLTTFDLLVQCHFSITVTNETREHMFTVSQHTK